ARRNQIALQKNPAAELSDGIALRHECPARSDIVGLGPIRREIERVRAVEDTRHVVLRRAAPSLHYRRDAWITLGCVAGETFAKRGTGGEQSKRERREVLGHVVTHEPSQAGSRRARGASARPCPCAGSTACAPRASASPDRPRASW